RRQCEEYCAPYCASMPVETASKRVHHRHTQQTASSEHKTHEHLVIANEQNRQRRQPHWKRRMVGIIGIVVGLNETVVEYDHPAKRPKSIAFVIPNRRAYPCPICILMSEPRCPNANSQYSPSDNQHQNED